MLAPEISAQMQIVGNKIVQMFCKVKEIRIHATCVLHLRPVGVFCGGRSVQQLVVGGAAPSVVNAHKFSTFPTCRQALPCIPTTLSVGRESALSAPVQGDQQNYSLQVSSSGDRKLQQTRAGVAIFFQIKFRYVLDVEMIGEGQNVSLGYFGTPSGQ